MKFQNADLIWEHLFDFTSQIKKKRALSVFVCICFLKCTTIETS